jgi:Protein of unknown function (DUF1360)
MSNGGYSPAEHRPLLPYAALSTTFVAGLGGALAALHANGHELPERVSFGDIALAGVATHKVARLIAKDKVTSFLRAPFTRDQEPGIAGGEVQEQPRGSGVRRAIGELLVCPYCLAQWVAAGFTLGLVATPRTTRLLASIYAAETLSDFLQAGYRAVEDRA